MTNAVPAAESEPVTLPTVRSHPFDPPSELGLFREEQPVRRLIYPDGHVGWLVTSHSVARAVLGDGRFSARGELQRFPVRAPGMEVFEEALPGVFTFMDPPEHTKYRRLLAGHFTVRGVNELSQRIERIVEDQLDVMEQAGPPVDLREFFALPIPSLAICELLGVPHIERDEFHRNTTTLVSMESTPQEAAAAWRAVTDFLRDLVQHKRDEPADDLLSNLAGSGELTDDELAGVGALLLLGGHETTANMLALGTFALLRHPGQLELLRADPSLIDSTVEELLRYLTTFQFGITRTALEDIELEGRLIRAGDTVTVSLAAANRDPQKFDSPDELDLTRSARGHLAFGHGVHMCIGQHLTRLELRIGYAALLRRFPGLRLAVAPEDVPMRADMTNYGVHRLPVAW